MSTPLLRGAEIVGSFYRTEDEKAIFAKLTQGEEILLELEPENEFDKFAVKVMAKDKENPLSFVHVGYVPATMSAVIFAVGDPSTLIAQVAEVITKAKGGVKITIDVSAP
jgi:HIRAN domain